MKKVLLAILLMFAALFYQQAKAEDTIIDAATFLHGCTYGSKQEHLLCVVGVYTTRSVLKEMGCLPEQYRIDLSDGDVGIILREWLTLHPEDSTKPFPLVLSKLLIGHTTDDNLVCSK